MGSDTLPYCVIALSGRFSFRNLGYDRGQEIGLFLLVVRT